MKKQHIDRIKKTDSLFFKIMYYLFICLKSDCEISIKMEPKKRKNLTGYKRLISRFIPPKI